jgi:hypothetical protein
VRVVSEVEVEEDDVEVGYGSVLFGRIIKGVVKTKEGIEVEI